MKLICGDCLEEMKNIPTGSIDLIITDPPYGTIKNASLDGWNNNTTKWDNELDIEIMFNECKRILRENGTMILFSQEPYTSKLRTYNCYGLEFAYPMIWKKNHFANALLSKKAPVSYFEDINVFYKKYDTDNKNELRIYFKKVFNFINKTKKQIINDIGQQADHCFRCDSSQFKICSLETYNKLIEKYNINKMNNFIEYEKLKQIDNKYQKIFNLYCDNKKSNILEYKKENQRWHPTQKPVALLEDLIKTYSNENDKVLDFTMGSGSTGVACVNTNRDFIGIELDENYFNIAKERINNLESKGE